jgi:hypothetical protein
MILEIILTNRALETISRHKRIGDKLVDGLRSGLQDSLVDTQRFIMAEELSGQLLDVRTGSLRRSVIVFTWSDPDALGGIVGMAKGPADAYAETQEKGKTITAKKGKYLAIPLPSALTGSGVIQGKYNVPLRTLNLMCFRSKAGNLILAERKRSFMKVSWTKADGTQVKSRVRFDFKPLFVLKKSVTIPEHGYMRQARDRLAGLLPGYLQERINRVLGA